MEIIAIVTNLVADSDIVQLIRQREQAGAEALYDSYARFLKLVIIRINPDREMAERALLKTFIRIWQEINDYAEKDGRIYTWMKTIAQNEAIATLTFSTKNYESKNQGLQTGKR